jgi:hypothetical protein
LDRKLFSESECGYLPIFAKKKSHRIKTGPAKNPKIEEKYGKILTLPH